MKHISAQKNKTVIFGVVIGTIAAILLSVILSAILVTMIQSKKTSDSVTPQLFAIRFISVMVGCLIGTQINYEKCFIETLLITGAYILILLCLGIMFFDGQFHQIATGVLASIGGGVLSCLFRLKSMKNKNQVYKTKR